MRSAPVLLLAALLFLHLPSGLAQSDQSERTGYISAIHSATEFDLNGERVLCDAKTQFRSPFDLGPPATPCADHIYIGEPLAIEQFSRKHGVLHAEILNINLRLDTQISGLAILDLPVPPGTTLMQGVLYADGRRLNLNKTTQLQFIAPLKSLEDVKPGTWVSYSAHPEHDGSFTASSITFTANKVSDREAKLLKSTSAQITPPDYAAKMDGEIRFGKSKHVWFHIVADQTLQERVQAIGMKLIPAWQKGLPEDDPLRVHYQFYVVTHKPVNGDAFSFLSGIILIPEKIPKETTDQQLAVILASNMAEILEKQGVRYLPGYEALGASGIATLATDFVPVPGLGLGMGLGSAIAASEMQRRQNQQADRVSLQLLHQAGYDINQSFLARNAVDQRGNATATPYSTRAQNLLASAGNWNAANMTQNLQNP